MILIILPLFFALLFVLVKSSEYFINAAARIANALGVSQFVIGLTIVSLGTTLPEVTTSVFAALAGTTGIAVGNAFGSVIANIGLILGFSAAVVAITVEREKLSRDCMIMLAALALLTFFAADGAISSTEGSICLAIVPIHFSLKLYGKYKGAELLYWPRRHLFENYLKLRHGLGAIISIQAYKKGIKSVYKGGFFRRVFVPSLTRDVFLLFGLAIAIGLCAKYIIDCAIWLVRFLNIGEGIIGATLIAVGTSLPELSVAISSIRKGFNNIMLGNIIGANILNLTLVSGAAAVIKPLEVAPSLFSIMLPFAFIMSFLLFIAVKTRIGIRKSIGLEFLAIYAAFLAFTIVYR